MKKILITCWSMEIGGVERSLLGLLSVIDYSQYQVDLFLCRHEGEFLNKIPSQVHLLPEIIDYTLFQKPIKEVIRKGKFRIGLIRSFYKLKVCLKARMGHQLTGDSLLTYYCKKSLGFLPDMSFQTYDIALSFLTPHYFTRYKVQAKKYVAWIHTDYTALHIDEQLEEEMWQAYDKIAAVSKECAEAFKKVFPRLEDKLIEIENILSPQLVRKQADEINVVQEMPAEEGVIKLCSVGRFSTAKGFDNAVRIGRILREQGIQYRWYFIGYGGDEPMIRAMIKEYGLEENIIILGKKINPYPYMKACDLYIQPSRYEGKAVAVREAQILGKIPIITHFETAPSQLEDGVDGIIVPMEVEACAKEIITIIENKELRKQLEEQINLRDYGNEVEVKKIYGLLEHEEEKYRPIKVLHCVGKMNCGGAETMVMNLYRQIDRNKVNFNFLVHTQEKGYYDDEILELGGRIYHIGSQGSLGIRGYIHTLTRFLKEEGHFDVVHSHMDWQGGFIALAAKRAGVRKVIVHAHTSKLMNKHIIYKFLLLIQKLCIARYATDYLACSKSAEHFLFYKGLCPKEKRIIFPNAIDLLAYQAIDRKAVRKELQIEEHTLLIGHIGSFSSFKNQLFLIKIAKKLQEDCLDFKMLLIGGGQENYKKQVIQVIRDNQLQERVEVLDVRNDIPCMMYALDLFVLPSLFEGLGIVAIEAQAAGTPCIVSEGVPKDIDMGLGLVSWVSLEREDKWIEKIEKMGIKEKVDEEICYQAITQKGYNILESTKQIQDLYTSIRGFM